MIDWRLVGFSALLWVSPLAIGLAMAWWAWARKRPFADQRSWWLGIVATGAALFITAVLIFTQSRGGLLGFGVALLGLSGRRARVVGLVGGIALAVLLIGLIWLMPAQAEALIFGGAEQAAEVTSLDTLAGRLEIWLRAIYGIQDFPLTGMGMNTFRRIVPVLYPLFLISPDFDIGHAHNTWLQAALDLGLPRLVAYLSIWILIVTMLIQTLRHPPDSQLRMLSAGLLSCLAGYFVYVSGLRTSRTVLSRERLRTSRTRFMAHLQKTLVFKVFLDTVRDVLSLARNMPVLKKCSPCVEP